MSRQAVFFDRDGVLVDQVSEGGRPVAARTLAEFRLLEGAVAAVARVAAAGFLRIVVTNQPEVAAGRLPADVLAQMHEHLSAVLPVTDILVCPHVDDDACACRKPKPGLLLAAAARWDIDPTRSYMVGDRWRDVDAGRAAGCYTVLIDGPHSGDSEPDARVADLASATDHILARERRG